MDILSGYSMQSNFHDLTNKSMCMERPGRKSIVSLKSSVKFSESSFVSAGHVIFDEVSSESDDCGVVKMTSFEESDSDDCLVQKVDDKVKSTGFYYKQKLKEITTKANVNNCFVEGESDEYGSEAAEEFEFEVPLVNFDILDIRKH